MKTTFELNNNQIKFAISWKEQHLKECPGIEHNFNFFFHENSNYCASIKCLKCNQGTSLYDFDAFDEEQASKYLKERTFHQPIFMGNGSHSVMESNKLHARLDYGIAMLGAQQQNGGMGTQYSIEFEEQAKQAILDVIKDITIALDYFKQ